MMQTENTRLLEIAKSGSGGAMPTAWTLDDEGNIRFTVASNGFSREQWEQHLEGRGWQISDRARQVLRRAREVPTIGVTYNIVVRPVGKTGDSDRSTGKICATAEKYGWGKPHWEVACLIRDTFTDAQLELMGMQYIVTMHEPIKDAFADPGLLSSRRHGVGARSADPDGTWDASVGGVAFKVPQVGP